MNLEVVNQFKDEIGNAGFEIWELPSVDLKFEAVEKIDLFRSSFGIAFLVFLKGETTAPEAALREIKSVTQSILGNALYDLENRKGHLLDGYLIIVLPEPPTDKLKVIVREFENDPKVCRKNIVWFSDDQLKLVRKEYITFLRLPDPLPFNSSKSIEFKISDNAQELLDLSLIHI